MRQLAVILLALAMVSAAAAGEIENVAAANASALVFAGSGANIAAARILAEAYARAHPDVKIQIPRSIGSTGAIRAAVEGAVSAGMIARPLRENEKGVELTVVPYARTAIVVGAHPSVQDEGIQSEDLVLIHQGKKTRWRNGREIVVLTREPGDSTIEVLAQTIPGFGEAFTESHRAKRWLTLFTDQDMAKTLARTPYAIGFSDMGAVTAERLPIKVLKVNGVLPTPENVTGGRYRLVKTLAFVFVKEKLSPEARAFIDFARTPAAKKALGAKGYLPGAS